MKSFSPSYYGHLMKVNLIFYLIVFILFVVFVVLFKINFDSAMTQYSTNCKNLKLTSLLINCGFILIIRVRSSFKITPSI